MFAKISVYRWPVVRTRCWYGKEKEWHSNQVHKVGPVYVLRGYKEGRNR